MATATTVTDIYNIVTDVLLEPWESGVGPGLTLGVLTNAEFISLFSLTLEDFVNRTGLIWSIFTQSVSFGISQYLQPNNLNTIKLCFLGGQYIDHSTLADLDDWQYDWRAKLDTPEYWHSDGLPPKTVELAATPNYNGASYLMPVDPTLQPPFGIYNLFNGATQGQASGAVSVSGTAVTWVSGSLFDLNWANYYPLPSIVIGGIVCPIESITDAQHLTITVSLGTVSANYTVNIGNDGNLTMVGTTGLDGISYTLGSTIPVVPDDACFYLAYGILARVFSTDGEAKDLQRAYYCQSRFQEGISALAAISGEMLAAG